MKSMTCKICGGTVALDASGMIATCEFCGNRFLLDHEDTDYYQDLFSRMHAFFATPKSDQERKQQAELLWQRAKTRTFIRQDGTPIEIKHMYCYVDKDADVYVARRNIVFHFPKQGAEKSELFRRSISLLDYPSADVRNLEEFFPKISGGFILEDGSYLLVINKHEDEYPLRLFGTLSGRHVAWIISRMENLSCVLEFSSLAHPQINLDTLYINPYTHQASLYGNWWNAGSHNTLQPNSRKILSLQDNLIGLRETAAALLGFTECRQVTPSPDIPQALADFIKSTPCPTAYDDFALWDTMLMKAYGERKFIKMDVDDEVIYGQKG